MTEIKSALELALERTKGIQGDKKTIQSNDLKNDGKRLASAYLATTNSTDEKAVALKIKAMSGDEKAWFKEGFFSVMVANLTLPSAEGFEAQAKQLEAGLTIVIKDRKQVSYIFQQVSQFFTQYLQSRDQLEEAVKQQYEPKLRQKEQQLEQQMGSKVKLTHEQDQEYLSMLAKNYSQLEEQYNQALLQVKEQLKQIFDSAK